MKHKFLQLLLLGILALGSAGSAMAQSGEYNFRGTIPFDFQVGEKKFKAGEYVIGRQSLNSPDVYVIRSADGKRAAIFTASSRAFTTTQGNSVLYFNKYENVHYLSQMNSPQMNVRVQTAKSEKKLMKNTKVIRIESTN